MVAAGPGEGGEGLLDDPVLERRRGKSQDGGATPLAALHLRHGLPPTGMFVACRTSFPIIAERRVFGRPFKGKAHGQGVEFEAGDARPSRGRKRKQQ